ncbi:ABC transporter permease [Pseudomonas gingeri]|uniref:ABC transporter permease n=1 Tax=Pseudomonas gingeri TaxID=117681 RepID=UPI0015A015FB|nr:ABC transporter permease [Pseudomonas gingeri]NVZ65210.1 ABC transporter permease [Pseudomonas gingeri]NVZ75815.1 ABC transporter permease [Pseudomonas gingeri]
MSKRNSWFNRCLTPKTGLPIQVIWSASALAWALLIGLWAVLSYGGVVPAMFLPTPGAVMDAALRLAHDGTLGPHVWASVEVVMVGFVISSVVAVPIGLLMGSFRVVQAFLEPLVNFIRYLPVTSFVPLFILWIGIGLEQRVSVIIFGVFFQQLVMIADVSKGISKDLINASYTLGSTRRDAVLHVITPASLPGVLDTLRVTMGWAWTYLVVAELVAASSGLGYLSLKAMRGFQVDVIFLAIAVIGLLGLVTDQLFRLLRLKVAAWAQ